MGSGITSLVEGVTIVRTRGYVELVSNGAAAVGDGFTGAVGIGVVTEPAFTAGIVSMPTPVTDIFWEGWMWHQMFSFRSGNIDQDLRQWFEIDSKAMRRINDGEVIFMAIEVTEIGTAVLEFTGGCRQLWKLP